MQDICKNAETFLATTRGQALHPGTTIPRGQYGYDLNSGGRNKARRSKACPTSWKTNHVCPETDQLRPMRHDGLWFTTDLEPGQNGYPIKNHRDNNGVVDERSKMIYSCDEFPPASFVEGGVGMGGTTPSTTRCAAIRCLAGVKAEQDCTFTSSDCQ